MNKYVRKSLVIGLALLMLPLGAMQSGTTLAKEAAKPQPVSKNLIVLIGDGMGPAQVSAARIYSKNKLKQPHLNLDSIYVGQATTFADKGEDGDTIVSGEVTDSASAGTAFATGHKTYNAAISVSNEDVSRPFASVIEASKTVGKSTGLVTTARITHATPAVYAAHVRNRDNENAIASQYLTSDVDVLLGGGKRHFVSKKEKGKREDKTIIPDFEKKGYKVVYDKKGLKSLTAKNKKILGLFHDSHVDYVLDRKTETPSLADMTSKAIESLATNPKGFTMMIEGGRIDHAGHANDLGSMIQETLDFDAAVKVALDFAKKDGNTSVVITADHETGGFSLSRDNIYELNVDAWDKQKISSELLGPQLAKAVTTDEVKELIKKYTGFTDVTEDEAQYIMEGDGSSYKQEGAFNQVMAKRYLVGWSGHGHSAVDVGVWAYGPISQLVKGQVDNTDIAKDIAQVAGLDLTKATAELRSKHLYPKFKVTREGSIMYPAVELAKALQIKVSNNSAAKETTFTKGKVTLKVKDGNTVTVNGQASTLPAELDRNVLYLNLDAFSKLTGQALKWDSLSERIALK
ncbi:alkaline phosphatase [Paenibacillus sp. MER TA 81-3]|uniref:alkaline phosphatase n=1 Tax=Paenibacillus sp. MER TA 81-3 TaxID=2939573 RepID=UPI00203E5A70|nr:alkaline phosphatase [Paenibacillus sp. MER TA 81-3]MCM3338148.1 alkaline phosphatase [Paenibacillus sp. MER TA 81-3]